MAEKREFDELVRLLSDRERIAATELPKNLATPAVLTSAWLAGVIEFGRRDHIVTGVANSPQDSKKIKDKVVIEDSFSWTGPKKNSHKNVKDLLAESDNPLNCQDFFRNVMEYSKEFERDIPVAKRVPVAEAEKELRLQVRLTDKGLASLAA